MARAYKLISGEHLFCSSTCRQEWYSLVWSQPEDWKKRSAERAARMGAEGRFSDRETNPQKKINLVLTEKKLTYIREYRMGNYSVDNFLPQYNLCIEVMGDFWHANPTIYCSPLFEQQKVAVARDAKKAAKIEQSCGCPPLYLWENDIEKNPDVVERVIDLFID